MIITFVMNYCVPILNGREYLEIFGENKPIGFKIHAMVSLAKINER